jgi:hypothetical protein
MFYWNAFIDNLAADFDSGQTLAALAAGYK